ncbi:MAG TPA: hypothetical protein VK539_07540 [Myxococcaceae bacterium]|nr:hypothetical protein [Myxococcaceae bacterium]
MKQIETGDGAVLDLLGARRERRLELYRARVADRMAANRVALETLYQGGTLFSPQGTQTGRALLKARQMLQRATTLVDLLSGEGVVPAPRLSERVEEVYGELDTLFSRSDVLSGRDEASVARLPRR